MTREESREQTRQRLLDAALTLIARKGLTEASVEDIAEEAGYSRGAFYSNFDDKASLLLALLERDQVQITGGLHAVFGSELPVDDFERAVLSYYLNTYRKSDMFLAWMEAKALAVRDAGFRDRMRVVRAVMQTQIAGFVAAYRQRTGIVSKIPPEQVAIGLMCLCDGVQFAHLADPDAVTTESVEAVLTHYFEAMVTHRP